MASFDKSIDVDVPVAEAYMLFSDFERFPAFMDGVESVERLGEDQLRWRANIAGREEEWTARITEQAPSHKIAWESTSGARNAGIVTFDKLGADRTRVNLHIEYEPEGIVENLGTMLGIVNGRMGADLERFKELVEEGGAARSGWHDEEGGLDEVTASDMMDGGQRREARLRQENHHDAGSMGSSDHHHQSRDHDHMHGHEQSHERTRTVEHEPDIDGSDGRLHSNQNLNEATGGAASSGVMGTGARRAADGMNDMAVGGEGTGMAADAGGVGPGVEGARTAPMQHDGLGNYVHRDPIQRGFDDGVDDLEGEDLTDAARRAEARGHDLRDPAGRMTGGTNDGMRDELAGGGLTDAEREAERERRRQSSRRPDGTDLREDRRR